MCDGLLYYDIGLDGLVYAVFSSCDVAEDAYSLFHPMPDDDDYIVLACFDGFENAICVQYTLGM